MKASSDFDGPDCPDLWAVSAEGPGPIPALIGWRNGHGETTSPRFPDGEGREGLSWARGEPDRPEVTWLPSDDTSVAVPTILSQKYWWFARDEALEWLRQVDGFEVGTPLRFVDADWCIVYARTGVVDETVRYERDWIDVTRETLERWPQSGVFGMYEAEPRYPGLGYTFFLWGSGVMARFHEFAGIWVRVRRVRIVS